MAKRLSDRVKELEAENARLMEQLTEVKKAYQEVAEQLEEQRSESVRNPRGAGRKPTEQTAGFAQFCELYNSGSSRKEIEATLGIKDATYFRYQKLKRDRSVSVADLIPRDIVMLQCLDEDESVKGTVCRDSSGKLYIKGFDGCEHYPSGTDKIIRIGHE